MPCLPDHVPHRLPWSDMRPPFRPWSHLPRIIHVQFVLTAAAGCPPGPPNFVFNRQKDIVGQDLLCDLMVEGMTLDDIHAQCSATSGCMAFGVYALDGTDRFYCLKGAAGPLTDLVTTWMLDTCQGVYVRGGK